MKNSQRKQITAKFSKQQQIFGLAKYERWNKKERIINLENSISLRNIFNKKLNDFENNMKKDGLSMTRFRIVNRETFKDKHEIIEVVI